MNGSDVTQSSDLTTLAAERDRALIAAAGSGVVSRMVIAASAVLSLGLAARALSTPEFGVVAVLSALVAYFAFGDFGLGAVLMSRVPASYARGDTGEVRRLVGSALAGLMMVATIALVIGSALLWLVPWNSLLGTHEVEVSDLRVSVALVFVIGSLGIVATVGTRALAALQRGALIRASMVGAALVTLGGAWACAVLDLPLWAFVLVFTFPTSALGLVHLVWYFRTDANLSLSREQMRLRDGLSMLGAGVPYAVLSLGWVVAYTLDAVVVSAVLGAPTAAVYAVGARLFGIVIAALAGAGQQMWPAISEAISRGDLPWVEKRFRHSVAVTAAVAATASLVLALAGPFLIRFWVGKDLVPPTELLIVFAVWTTYLATVTQYSYLLIASERIRALAGLGIIVAVANLSASILLTNAIGVTGPLLGNLLAGLLIQLLPIVVWTRRLTRELRDGSPDRESESHA